MAKEQIVELVSFEAKSFRGISKESKVFIDFSSRKKEQGFTELSGKQGTRKSSVLTGIAYSIGSRFNLDKKQLMNRVDGAIEENTVVKVNGEIFRIETGSQRITVKKKIDGEDKWTTKGVEQAPQEFLIEVFGRVIFIPADVQYMDGKKQIMYFQEMFASGDEAGKKMKELEGKITVVFETRRDHNREVKMLTSALELEPLYQNYEKSQQRFDKPVSADKEKAKYDGLKKKKDDFEKYSDNLVALQNLSSNLANSIKQLETQLAAAKKEKEETDTRIKKGQAWVGENKGVVKEFDTAEKDWLNLSQILADYEKWKDILRREKQLIEKQDVAMDKDAELIQLREDLLKLTKRYLPKVQGLTIKVAAGLDKTEAQEGVFYTVPGKKEEQPLHELSESEYEDMWLLILEAEDAQFVFLENLNRFGTNVVETLNRIVKAGGQVFYTLMNREQTDMGVTFKSQVK